MRCDAVPAALPFVFAAMFAAMIACTTGCVRNQSKEEAKVGLAAASPQAENDFVLVNPELSDAERADFYHLSEGSELIPRKWFDALKAKDADGKRVFFKDQLGSLGFLADPGQLPVGLTSAPVRGLDPTQDMVGINCAACHVGEIIYKSQSYRIDGGPNMTDIRSFFAGMATALEDTLRDPAALVEFLQRCTPRPKWPRAKCVTSCSSISAKTRSTQAAPLPRLPSKSS